MTSPRERAYAAVLDCFFLDADERADATMAMCKHFERCEADARRAALAEAFEVFADFKTTPTDEHGRMETTQGEVARITEKLRALLTDPAMAPECLHIELEHGGARCLRCGVPVAT
jgi:hypothetical protein